MKKYLFFLILIIFIACIFVYRVILLRSNSVEYSIFESISECDALKSSTLPNAKFENLDPNETDDNISGLIIKDSFCGNFSCDEFEFIIFAYEFIDSESAKQYYINNTGKKNDPSTSFSESRGPFSGELIVLDLERVYRIKMKTKYRDEVCNFLNETFSKKIEV